MKQQPEAPNNTTIAPHQLTKYRTTGPAVMTAITPLVYLITSSGMCHNGKSLFSNDGGNPDHGGLSGGVGCDQDPSMCKNV